MSLYRAYFVPRKVDPTGLATGSPGWDFNIHDCDANDYALHGNCCCCSVFEVDYLTTAQQRARYPIIIIILSAKSDRTYYGGPDPYLDRWHLDWPVPGHFYQVARGVERLVAATDVPGGFCYAGVRDPLSPWFPTERLDECPGVGAVRSVTQTFAGIIVGLQNDASTFGVVLSQARWQHTCRFTWRPQGLRCKASCKKNFRRRHWGVPTPPNSTTRIPYGWYTHSRR